MTTILTRKIGRECCAPISGEGSAMVVCGLPVKEGSSYCPGHHERFWMPLTRAAGKVVIATAIGSGRQQSRVLAAPLTLED